MTDQKSWIVRAGVAAAGVVGLAVVAPLVYFAFLSALGLVGIALLGLASVAVITALPMLGQKLENRLLAMRIAEARKHPIEQLRNRVNEKQQKLDAFNCALLSIAAQISGAQRELYRRKKEDPEHDLSGMEQDLSRIIDMHQVMRQKYRQAEKSLADYRRFVDRKAFEFGLGNSLLAAASAMNMTDADNMMKDMLANESFKAVDQTLDTAFASLEVECAKINETDKLEYKSGITIDMTALRIPEEVKA